MSNATKRKSSILQKLEANSKITYDKVARKMELAANIADAMEIVSLSKTQFANKMGKKPSEISKWLSGTHNFTYETLIDISRVLGTDICTLTTPLFKVEDNSYTAKSNITIKKTCSKPKVITLNVKSKCTQIPYNLLNHRIDNKHGYC